MTFVILSIMAAALYVPAAGKNFKQFWKTGLIGVAIMLIADYLGARFNLYIYREGVIFLGIYPLFHIVQIYFFSLFFLNWLPERWTQKIMYTVCASVLFLAVESAMNSLGAIEYINWKLWYSFFLDMAGLLLLAFFSELAIKSAGQRPVK